MKGFKFFVRFILLCSIVVVLFVGCKKKSYKPDEQAATAQLVAQGIAQQVWIFDEIDNDVARSGSCIVKLRSPTGLQQEYNLRVGGLLDAKWSPSTLVTSYQMLRTGDVVQFRVTLVPDVTTPDDEPGAWLQPIPPE